MPFRRRRRRPGALLPFRLPSFVLSENEEPSRRSRFPPIPATDRLATSCAAWSACTPELRLLRESFQIVPRDDLFISIRRLRRLPHPSAKARTSPKPLDLTVDPVIMMMTSPPLLLCAHHPETMAANEHIYSAPVRPPARLASRTSDDSPYFRPFELCQQQTKSAPLVSSPHPHSTMIVSRPSPPIQPWPSSWPWPWQSLFTSRLSSGMDGWRCSARIARDSRPTADAIVTVDRSRDIRLKRGDTSRHPER